MGSWKPIWLTRFTVLALMLSVFSACDEDTLSPDDVDPLSTSTAIENAVLQFFTGNEAVLSLDALGPAIGAALNVSPSFLFLPEPGLGNVHEMASSVRTGLNEFSSREGATGARLMASIPVGLLGKTLVYNPNAVPPGYEIDATRTDAPANGVRFALYSVNPILMQPLEPLQEIGYIDIVDTSSFPTISITLTAVIGTETLVNYSVTGSFSATGFTLDASGYLSDGSANQLNFDFSLSGTETSGMATLDLSYGNVSVHVEAQEDAVAGTASVSVTITHDANQIAVAFTEKVDGTFSGTVSFNGSVVAVISGSGETVSVTNAEGGALTAEQLAGVERVFIAVEEMFFTVEELFGFAFTLIAFGAV